MFETIRNSKRIVQGFLALIALSFAFFGVDAYVRNGRANTDVATVGGTPISAYQFDQSMRERQDQLRRALGANFRPEMMAAPEVRLSVLNGMIDQRLILLEADKSRLHVTDAALREVISTIPEVQENGKFSMALYANALRAKGLSEQQFEANLRQDLTIQQLLQVIGGTAVVSATQSAEIARIQFETRDYAEYRISAEQFADKVKISADAVKKYYDDNQMLFQVPEQVKAEFVVLSLDTLLTQVTVPEAEIKTWYDSHKDRYQQAEERRASHILIQLNEGSDKAKAKTKAEEILKKVQQSPGSFADLAKQYSEDTGSAKNGGDLGYFSRGMMVKPFEDTVFVQKDGEISGVVASDFGYHIIKLTGVKPAKVRSLEEVRPEIEGELKKQIAARKFAESAEAFNNTVYEQADSLQPAAEKFKLKIQQSAWVPRNPNPQLLVALGGLGNDKVLKALFSDDALKNKRNIEAVEVAPNTLLAARVLEYVPAAIKPFDVVKADIEKRLKLLEAAAMAKSTGEAALAALKGGEDKIAWVAQKGVSRAQAQQLPPATAQALFKADMQKLPAYVGVSLGSAYAIYKITKVSQPEKVDEARREAIVGELARLVGQEDLAAYLTGLRARYKVKINHAALETKERP